MKQKLIEKLAELEHNQWMDWSKSVGPELMQIKFIIKQKKYKKSIILLRNIMLRWILNWIPYNDLSDKMKEKDRKYARKIISLLLEYGIKGHDDFNNCICININDLIKK